VTGNPGFDDLCEPYWLPLAHSLRAIQGWGERKVVLWVQQVEPTLHPFTGQPSDPTLPDRAWRCLVDWALTRPDVVVCLRYRAGQALPAIPIHGVVALPPDIPLAALLHATDTVVTLNSTVGLEGHLLGTKVIQVLGSVFDSAVPFLPFGIADEAVPCDGLPAALERCLALPRKKPRAQSASATQAVLAVLRELLPC